MKLAIISHTEHYIDIKGDIVGWGPTVREINHLAVHFDKIYHVACLHKGQPPPSSLRYIENNIEFVPIPPSGGYNLIDKLSVLQTMPEVIRSVSKVIRQVDYFQLRLPTGFGNYLLPWLKFHKPKAKFWIKYAGNWTQKNPPLGYAFQRWFLKNNFLKCKVTVNGHWPGQPDHILSFENPCLTEEERKEGKIALNAKDYHGNIDFVFVGQLTENKGIRRIIEAFRQLNNKPRIGILHLVGDGPDRKIYENLAAETGINCKFHGFLPREEVNKVLAKTHVLLLPSVSEGFPKVVAEGANFGCIPVVSAVSSIPQYIFTMENGFIMPSIDASGLIWCINKLLSCDGQLLKQIAFNGHQMAAEFTYDHYISRIKKDILKNNN